MKQKQTNTYTIKVDAQTGLPYAEFKTRAGRTFKVDTQDAERVAQECLWHANRKGYILGCCGPKVYAHGCLTARHEPLHIYLMGRQVGKEIDHINNDPSDNRRSNLRFVTHRENALNAKNCKYGSKNKTGFIGVSQQGARFAATTWLNGKIHWIGRGFYTAEQAARAYDAFIETHHPGELTNKTLGRYTEFVLSDPA